MRGPFTRMHPLNTNTNPSFHPLYISPSSHYLHHSYNLISCCCLLQLTKPNPIILKNMEVVMKLVETPPYYEPPQHHTQSRPTLGFPLGTALLLIIIFSLSGFFSCCYHWDKLRHLRGSFVDPDTNDSSPTKPNLKLAEEKEIKKESLPVIMAGDRIAKFMALPSPREPPREHKIIVQEVQKPPKPPHIVVPMY